MAQTYFNICPADCSTEFTYPALDSDQNCVGNVYLSQITDLWILPNSADDANAPFTDWSSGSHTLTANPSGIDNTEVLNAKTKWLTVVGDLPAPEKTVQRVHKRQDVTTNRRYTLNLIVYNLSNAQYAALRQYQCNPTSYTFWYGNDSHVFGKDTGLIPVGTDVDFPLGAGDTDVEQAVLTIIFEAKVDPERKVNPYADTDAS